MADCLRRWAYPASKGMTYVFAHGDEAETVEAKKIIDMERMMEEEGVKCFVVMAADAPLSWGVDQAVHVLAPEGAESDMHLFLESCLQDNWNDDYTKSEAFQSEYRPVTDPDNGQKWPKGLTDEAGKLFRNGRLLVLESRVLELCETWHHHMVHPGVRKQAQDMQQRFEVNEIDFYRAIRQVKKGCSVCQACNPDNRNVTGEPNWTPVRDQPMESVAMDIFSMPKVHIGKEVFDCVVLCVDRRSGYIVAVPAQQGFASQGSGNHDGSPLADRLWHPPHHLQRPWTLVHMRMVQGDVFPHGNTTRQERGLSQPVQWSSVSGWTAAL